MFSHVCFRFNTHARKHTQTHSQAVITQPPAEHICMSDGFVYIMQGGGVKKKEKREEVFPVWDLKEKPEMLVAATSQR